jgi:competence protein ComFC
VQLVKKTKHTISQTKLSRQQRLVNMTGSFGVNNTESISLYQTIIIVDDIVTTGATINEIALTIKKHNPQAHIRGLVVGRHNK